MNIAEIRKIFKENTLRNFQVLSHERKIVFVFENDHSVSVEIEGHPGTHYEWEESIVLKIDGDFVVST